MSQFDIELHNKHPSNLKKHTPGLTFGSLAAHGSPTLHVISYLDAGIVAAATRPFDWMNYSSFTTSETRRLLFLSL